MMYVMIRESVKSRFLHTYAMVMLCMHAMLLFASWAASIYVDDINPLLAPRGIRWMCSSIEQNFVSAPVAPALMVLMAFSVLCQSGMFSIFKDSMSLKKRRALHVTIVVAICIMVIFSLLLFMPNAILLSAFGTISHSAFTKGLFGLAVMYVIVVSAVYGYTSGRISSMSDVVESCASIFSSVGSYIVVLFVVSQFVGALHYTSLLHAMGDDGKWMDILSNALYYMPLAVYFLLAHTSLIPHSSHSGD